MNLGTWNPELWNLEPWNPLSFEVLMKSQRLRVSRRQFLGATAGTLAAGIGSGRVLSGQTLQTGSARGATTPAADQTIVLTNGRIHTMNTANAVVNTLSIRNGRFVRVGGPSPAAGPNTRVIDLKGRTVVPGLIEAARPQREPGEPARAITRSSRTRRRSARSRKRWPRGARTCPRASGSRRWAAGIRTSGPSIAIRRARSSTRPCPIGRCCCTSASPVRARRTASARRSSTLPTRRRRCIRTSRR